MHVHPGFLAREEEPAEGPLAQDGWRHDREYTGGSVLPAPKTDLDLGTATVSALSAPVPSQPFHVQPGLIARTLRHERAPGR